jgi:hypothetical protein
MTFARREARSKSSSLFWDFSIRIQSANAFERHLSPQQLSCPARSCGPDRLLRVPEKHFILAGPLPIMIRPRPLASDFDQLPHTLACLVVCRIVGQVGSCQSLRLSRCLMKMIHVFDPLGLTDSHDGSVVTSTVCISDNAFNSIMSA